MCAGAALPAKGVSVSRETTRAAIALIAGRVEDIQHQLFIAKKENGESVELALMRALAELAMAKSELTRLITRHRAEAIVSGG